jgi:hypothetical protein
VTFFLPPTQTAQQQKRIVREHSSRGQGKRDGRSLKNDLSYYLVIVVVIIVVINCASLPGGKHEETRSVWSFAPWGGIFNEHLLVDVSSGTTG